MHPITTRNFKLHDWQREAADSWVSGDGTQGYRGTMEIFTGGGKTLIALACAEEAAKLSEHLRVAVVVPTEALALQWRESIVTYTDVERDDVGLLGAGGMDDLASKRVLVAVLNTAARRLPDMVRSVSSDTMLIVDECHRAGAPSFARVLDAPARFRLGLSATPDRDELDEDGELLDYDAQLVGRALGKVTFRFSLREARLVGWLPEFSVHHHGVELVASERSAYDRISRQIDDLTDRLNERGVDRSRARAMVKSGGDVGRIAGAYVAATAKRKDLLYRASERTRIAERVVGSIVERRSGARILMFHERVDEAVELRNSLAADLGFDIGIEHSRLGAAERRRTLDYFRDGSHSILVSVRSLIEGIDVPSADVGISVASSSSVRQRIQSLGRVLRRTFDGAEKVAEMHVLYVADTVDDLIYAKEDWSDLTGAAANFYYRWPPDGSVEPRMEAGPPRTPRPTEEQEWERFGGVAPQTPEIWMSSQPDREYSVDVSGTVRNPAGALIANPQGVASMVEAVRDRPGGRFYVTPAYHLVVVREASADGRLMLAGQLAEPLVARAEPEAVDELDVASLPPGVVYQGPLDKDNGEYRISQKRGGVIERNIGGGVKQFAFTDEIDDERAANGRRVIAAWRSLSLPGCKIAVNSRGHVWYVTAGEPRFLAAAWGGFAWPSEMVEGN